MPSTTERECPICFRAYSWDRLRMGPGGKCSHGFCLPCGEALAKATKELPFRCPICREDVSAWFVEQFDWVSQTEREKDERDLDRGAQWIFEQRYGRKPHPIAQWFCHHRSPSWEQILGGEIPEAEVERIRMRAYDLAHRELYMSPEELRSASSSSRSR